MWALLVFLQAVVSVESTVLAADMRDRHQPASVRATRLMELPDDLRDHFREHGIRLRREVMYSGSMTEWIVVDLESNGRCEMRTSFVRFDANAPIADIRRYLSSVSVPAELQETARLAMFAPWWRGTTSEKETCDEYVARSKPRAAQLLAAFRTYVPRNRLDKRVRKSE